MRVHGVTSIILAGLVFGMSFVSLIGRPLAAAAYLLFVAAGFYVIVYSYCAKCTARKICSHIVLGALTGFVPARKTEPYKKLDIISMAGAFFLLYAVSFIVLWPHKAMFYAALVLTAVTVFEIKLLVCPGCKNIFCPIKKLGNKNTGIPE